MKGGKLTFWQAILKFPTINQLTAFRSCFMLQSINSTLNSKEAKNTFHPFPRTAFLYNFSVIFDIIMQLQHFPHSFLPLTFSCFSLFSFNFIIFSNISCQCVCAYVYTHVFLNITDQYKKFTTDFINFITVILTFFFLLSNLYRNLCLIPSFSKQTQNDSPIVHFGSCMPEVSID